MSHEYSASAIHELWKLLCCAMRFSLNFQFITSGPCECETQQNHALYVATAPAYMTSQT